MTAHKKTLIRQAGSAEAFIDSLPLVVNCCKYSANLTIFQYLLTQISVNGSTETRKTMDIGEFIGFGHRRDTWAFSAQTMLSRRNSRHFGAIREWGKNGTLNAPPLASAMKNPLRTEFTRQGHEREMGHRAP
jgi:hypothetical protein